MVTKYPIHWLSTISRTGFKYLHNYFQAFFAFFLLSVFSHMFFEYSRWKYAKHALVSTWTGSFILIEKVETEEIHQRTRKRIQTTKSLYIYQIEGVKAKWF